MVLYGLGIIVDGMLIYEKIFKKIDVLNRVKYKTKGQFLATIFELNRLGSENNKMRIKLTKYLILISGKVPKDKKINNLRKKNKGFWKKLKKRLRKKKKMIKKRKKRKNMNKIKNTRNGNEKISKKEIKNTILGYVIGDHKISLKYTQKFIKKMLKLYINYFYEPNTSGIIKNYSSGSELDKEIEKLIGDFYMDSIDRFANIFY
ncbi:MAG: hypothetical protein ACTSRZ_05815 [Promethearchaeota archaeon]